MGDTTNDFQGNPIPVKHFTASNDILLPSFGFSRASTVYVEGEYNPRLNGFFQANIEKVQELFSTKDLEFIYIPQLISSWGTSSDELMNSIQYMFPALSISTINSVPEITTADFSISLLGGIVSHDNNGWAVKVVHETIGAGLLRYTGHEYQTNNTKFNLSLLDNVKDEVLWDYLNFYTTEVYTELNPIIDDDICLSPAIQDEIPPDDDFADASFKQEAHRIAKEITIGIDTLKHKGYKGFLLQIIAQALNKEERTQLTSLSDNVVSVSRLLITKDYRLILVGFNDLEVKMTPLPKAVFFLFLRHPEGILFKHLPEYRKELLAIYQMIAYKETPEEVKRSINELTNPRSNSINEKCSRIKEAFIKLFDNSIAEHYYITGQRAEPKKIRVASSPDLITWDIDLMHIPNSNSHTNPYLKERE